MPSSKGTRPLESEPVNAFLFSTNRGKCRRAAGHSILPFEDDVGPHGVSREGQGRRSWMTRHSRKRHGSGASRSWRRSHWRSRPGARPTLAPPPRAFCARLEKAAIPIFATLPTPGWALLRSMKTRARRTRRFAFSSPSFTRPKSRWQRAVIVRSLGNLGDRRARHEIVKAVNDVENAVIRVEACRALGKVGLPGGRQRLLARIMTIDKLEDCRIAAIEGLGLLKAKDARIYGVLLDGLRTR